MSNRFSNDYKKGFVQGSRAGYKSGERIGGRNELELFSILINEKKIDRISNDSYNITIEVVAFENLKNHIEKRLSELETEKVKK